MVRTIFFDGVDITGQVDVNLSEKKIAKSISDVLQEKVYLQRVETIRPIFFFANSQVISYSSSSKYSNDISYYMDGNESVPYDIDKEYKK